MEYQVNYLGDKFMEETSPALLKETVKWLQSFKGFKDEAGYPVEVDCVQGFMFVSEFWHSGMKDDIASSWVALNSDRTEKFVYNMLVLIKNELVNKYESLKIIVTRNVGPLDCHEICVFFPINTRDSFYLDVTEDFGKLVVEKLHKIR